MSFAEELCRWSIVQGYVEWKLSQGDGFVGLLGYALALGIDLDV